MQKFLSKLLFEDAAFVPLVEGSLLSIAVVLFACALLGAVEGNVKLIRITEKRNKKTQD